MILIDTCIWSEALRKKKTKHAEVVGKLTKIITENQAAIIGPIRQELLSGVKEKKMFTQLRERLSCFPDVVLSEKDYEQAAEYFNLCQKKGVQGSNTDFLICSVSNRLGAPIFTVDKDFDSFQKILKIKLLEI